jgi:RinA family phage transcriptional activator
MQLSKGAFRHIESELYSYEDTKQEIERLRNDIIHASPVTDNPEGGRSNAVGDPTGRVATLLLTHRRLEQLEKIVEAIERVYRALPEEKQILIKLKYWKQPQTLTWEGIAQKVHVSRRQVLRWRDAILYAIAEQLGWR